MRDFPFCYGPVFAAHPAHEENGATLRKHMRSKTSTVPKTVLFALFSPVNRKNRPSRPDQVSEKRGMRLPGRRAMRVFGSPMSLHGPP
jgi:hypothetical protein